jgi:hypothetical protein
MSFVCEIKHLFAEHDINGTCTEQTSHERSKFQKKDESENQDNGDQGELREAIRHERRVELGLEFDRFYDLVRWGIAKEVLHAAGKTNYQDKNALLPLPQTEIDKSKGVLVQNPDYQ